MYRFIVISITAIVVLLLGATAISAASQSALPGDSLYSVKTSLEDAQMSSAADVETKAKLNINFAQKRLGEIKVLAEMGRLDKIEAAMTDMEIHLADAKEQVQQVSVQNVEAGASLSLKLVDLIAEKEQVMSSLALSPTVSDSTSIDNNANDDNANDNDANDNDDNDNANDDNANDNDANDNEDNGNTNEDNGNDDNGNANNEDNGNEDNGNANEDNGDNDNSDANEDNDNNDNDDNSNANEDNGNEDNGNDNDDDDDGD